MNQTRILVVEDNDALRTGTIRRLETFGAEVIGEASVEAAEQHIDWADLVILDLLYPENQVQGKSVIAEWRRRAAIIAWSGDQREGTEAMIRGANAFVLKGETAPLFEKIAEVLEHTRARREVRDSTAGTVTTALGGPLSELREMAKEAKPASLDARQWRLALIIVGCVLAIIVPIFSARVSDIRSMFSERVSSQDSQIERLNLINDELRGDVRDLNREVRDLQYGLLQCETRLRDCIPVLSGEIGLGIAEDDR